MLSRLLSCRCVLAATVLVVASLAERTHAAPGMPEKCRLTIDGEVYDVPVGKAFAVMIGEKRVTMRLDPQTESKFGVGGVRFAYPASLVAAEPVEEGGVTIWSFEGESAALMLQRYDGELAPDSLLQVLADNIANQYEASDVERRAVQLRGAEQTYRGQQLQVRPGATKVSLVQSVFTFVSNGEVYALIVQDTSKGDTDQSDEYRATLQLLGKTLTTRSPAEAGTSDTPAAR